MNRYAAPTGWSYRSWDGEATSVLRLDDLGTTHLLDVEALAVVQAAAAAPEGMTIAEIAHALGFEDGTDPEAQAALSRIIEALLESGVLRRCDARADPRRDLPP